MAEKQMKSDSIRSEFICEKAREVYEHLKRNFPGSSDTEIDEFKARKPQPRVRAWRNVFLFICEKVAVITLVIVDCLFVISELLIDLEILTTEKESSAPHVLHYLSISILSLFIIEIGAKLYAFRLEFFHHKLEVFDAVIVLVSFVLDITFRDKESAVNGVGLLIILRLWRVARVLNGIVLSVKTQADHKLAKEQKKRENLEQELVRSRDYIAALEEEVETLRRILKDNNIKELPPTVIDNRAFKCTILNVVAEVNHMIT
ncbi:voltage-gated hydrogen channel 1-like isoform X2 [Tachypleus tridentatus]|uniref:voltage-gated hydrogen channel 1-like isoform X2 n=1 Tax=Tachypleus tridentatus TaxID=6853 RepID=UPI003FD4FC8D